MAVVAEQVRLVMTEAVAANNNKYWYATRHSDGTVFVEWGRIGTGGQSQTKNFGSDYGAESFIKRKIKEKEKKGYRRLNTVEAPSGNGAKAVTQTVLDQIGAKSKAAKDLVVMMRDTNAHQITSATTLTYDSTTGLFSTPCGVVAQSNVDEARKLLVKLRRFVGKDSVVGTKLLADYLMLVPQDIGRERATLRRVLPNDVALSKQEDILDGLDGSLAAIAAGRKKKSKKKVEEVEQVFDVTLTLAEDKRARARIEKLYTVDSGHSCSHLLPIKIFKVEIGPMKTAYVPMAEKLGNVKHLWHGTNVGNLLSIMSKGLIIPKSAAHGRAYGNGVYFSDQATKALNYAYGYWGGRRSNSRCFMLLVDVAMGKTHRMKGWNYGGKFPVKGTHSTFAGGGGSLRNNEMIVYQIAQCNITHLVEFG